MNLILLASLIAADPIEPVVKLPTEISGKVGAFLPVRSESDGPQVRWVALDDGLSVFPGEMLKDSRTTVVIGMKAGKYRLGAYTAKGDVPSLLAICLVTIGDAPGPKPPDPPTPPPDPVDPLAKKIRDAFPAKPTQADKDAAVALQGLFLELSPAIMDAKYVTVGDFLAVYRQVAGKVVLGDTILAVRNLVSQEVAGVFNNDPEASLNDAGRMKAAALFSRLASIFGTLRAIDYGR